MRVVPTTIILGLLVLMIGCDQIIEKDISKEKIIVNAPLAKRSEIYTQTFWWEEVKGASSYRLQIVYNRFDSLPLFRLDTLVKTTKFTLTLRPAVYQWRLWAENGSSRSDTVSHRITIDSSTISRQQINVSRTNPSASSGVITTNSPSVNFYWEKLEGATTYQVQIASDTASQLSSPQETLNYTLTMAKEGTYYVRVIGKNTQGEESIPSERFTVIFDKTGPAKVTLSSPNDNFQIPLGVDSVTLVWNKVPDAVAYNLYVARDSAGLSTKTPIRLTGTSFLYKRSSTQLGDRNFWWMVIGEDSNKNKGAASEKRSFNFFQ